jgi:hypothetical protein
MKQVKNKTKKAQENMVFELQSENNKKMHAPTN